MAASYQNNMALPFAYAVSDLRKADNIAQQSVFSNENSFVTGITGKHKNYFGIAMLHTHRKLRIHGPIR